jgi:hypothetical protein
VFHGYLMLQEGEREKKKKGKNKRKNPIHS